MEGPSFPDPVIDVAGLNHWFGSEETQRHVLRDLGFRLPRGGLTALIGASGSGKTTLLTILGGLRAVQHGSVRLLGEELNGVTPSKLSELRRRFGFIFQGHNLHGSLTARQNVMMGVKVKPNIADDLARDAAAHALELLGLGDRLDELPANLSGGQNQRVAVARALVGNPEIVLADEPTAALDRDSAMQVVCLLKRLGATRGTTTLLVTHDSRILERADAVLRLEDGSLLS